jgi:GT2 family glycosyltransferase
VKVSVIVVAYESASLLPACLDSALAQPETGELIVVDNASGDGSADLVARRYPATRLVRNTTNVGFPRAVNQGLAQAAFDHALLLNPDAVLGAGCLSRLLAFAATRPAAGILGPALLNPDGSRQPSWGRFPSLGQELMFQSFLFRLLPCRFPLGRRVHPLLRGTYARRQRVDWVTGAALLVSRPTWERTGGLPVDGFMYGEDLELCASAAVAGIETWYVPEAEAQHGLGIVSRREPERWIERYTRATLRYHARHSSPGVQVAVARSVIAGSRLRQVAWSVAGLWPPLRDEARSRLRGYEAGIAAAHEALRAARTT